jgi:pimeloyl-ACP methyl ester carboxylesterase
MLIMIASGCAPRQAAVNDVFPTPQLDGLARERREVRFISQSVTLAGELDLPIGDSPVPLAFVIHHSGPVPRDAYGYLAEILIGEDYAVFRFDQRGTGLSAGEYGCCESEDALAAYRAAVEQDGIDRCNIFIIAQSIGTQHLADRFDDYAHIQPPRGVVLLSNVLHADQIGAIAAPVHIIVSDSEPGLESVGRAAVEAHQAKYPFGASYYVADHTEHTLFDIQAGPIDWSNPEWTRRYHRGAMQSLIGWMKEHRVVPDACTPAEKLNH